MNNVVDIFKTEFAIAALFNIPEHVMQIEAVKTVHRLTGEDYSRMLLVAPAQNSIPADAVMLEPTELGKRLGYSTVEMNQVLARLGMQVKTDSGWMPTAEGMLQCSRHSWSVGSKSGYNFKWNLQSIENLLGV